jgi:hypothetical protein
MNIPTCDIPTKIDGIGCYLDGYTFGARPNICFEPEAGKLAPE